MPTPFSRPASNPLSDAWPIVFFLGLADTFLFAIFIWFMQTNLANQYRSDQNQHLTGIVKKISAGLALTIARTLLSILTTSTAVSVESCFDIIRWNLISRKAGPSLDQAVFPPSSGTGPLGILQLLEQPEASWKEKGWIFLRGTTQLVIYISALALFFQTDTKTIYDTAYTYNVTAGIGPFNGSYVRPFIDSLQADAVATDDAYRIFPSNYYSVLYNLVTDPAYAVLSDSVLCYGDGCASYLINGGLEMVTPTQPSIQSSEDLVKIHNVPTVQLEFSQPAPFSFDTEDCSLVGPSSTTIAIRLCVAEVEGDTGKLSAGIYVCPNGIANPSCGDLSASLPNVTTTMTSYTGKSSLVFNRTNYSIVSVGTLSEAEPVTHIDSMTAYKDALHWLLNYTVTNITGSSAVGENFWEAAVQLPQPEAHGQLSQNLQSILAFPIWFFNANNQGNAASKGDEFVQGLPGDFYTQASTVVPYGSITFDLARFRWFAALEVAALVFLWAVLLWSWVFGPTISRHVMIKASRNTADGLRVDDDKALQPADGLETRLKRD